MGTGSGKRKAVHVGWNYVSVKDNKMERLRGGADPVPGPSKQKDGKPKVISVMKLAPGAISSIRSNRQKERVRIRLP